MSRAKELRKSVIESGSPLARHSLNQAKIKLALEGDKRLGFLPARAESQLEKILTGVRGNELFELILGKVESFDIRGLPVPARIGRLGLAITSLVNQELKYDPADFVTDASQFKRLKFLAGTPFENLIPKQLMVNGYLIDTGQIPPRPDVVKKVHEAAGVFAHNFGGVRFNEEPEVTVVLVVVAFQNISRYIAKEIQKKRLSARHARRMVVVFGETVDRHLAKF